MYNGIGLQTARGSGTSGYVQKNLSFVKPYNQIKQRDSFLKDLAALKDNVLAPPKKANKDILLHQQKRDIQLQLLKFREKMEGEGKTPEEIEERVKKAEKILNEKLESGELELASAMDYHKKAAEKEKEYERVRQAFQMSEDYKPGSAFDFEAQEKKRLEQLYEKEKKKYEQKKAEKKAEKERLKAEEGMPAIEGEVRPEQTRKDVKKADEPTEKLTNKELRERQEANRRNYEKERRDNRSRYRSRSPRDSRRDDRRRDDRGGKERDEVREKGRERERGEREDREKEREKEKEKDRVRQRSTSREKARAKDSSKDRAKDKGKEDVKKRVKDESKERTRRRKRSSSSEKSEKSSRSPVRERKRRDSSSSSSESRSRSGSSSKSRSSSSSRSD